jgi:hypothetical protein
VKLKIIIIFKNNYRYEDDINLRLFYKEKDKRVVLADIRCIGILNAAFLVVN